MVNSSRLLLSKLRGGDYAHPGDTEVIDIILKKVLSFDPLLKDKAVLDVGSGFGGTVHYLSQKGFRDIQGVVFDYTCKEKENHFPLKDFVHKTMNPLHIPTLKEDLAQAKWDVLETTDMTKHYIIWYKDLLKKLTIQTPWLKKEFSDQDILRVKETFTTLLSYLEKRSLGGMIVYARKQR